VKEGREGESEGGREDSGIWKFKKTKH
jgi:hypothetical protein